MKTAASLEELIGTHPFLTRISSEFQSFLCDCGSLRRFGSQQQVFQEGGEADHFYLIVSGKVAVEATVAERGRIIIQTLGAGDALGWSWLFPPHQWCFTAITTMPTEVLSFGAQLLRQKVREDADFAKELLTRITKILVERLQATRNELIRLYRVMSEHKLAA
jgi:CRP/FNR family cyclic AMP-dependent transcriptional regulator